MVEANTGSIDSPEANTGSIDSPEAKTGSIDSPEAQTEVFYDKEKTLLSCAVANF